MLDVSETAKHLTCWPAVETPFGGWRHLVDPSRKSLGLGHTTDIPSLLVLCWVSDSLTQSLDGLSWSIGCRPESRKFRCPPEGH